MSKGMNWDRERFRGKPTEPISAPDRASKRVTIRCRKCGHVGRVNRWKAEHSYLRCSKCGWKGSRP